MQRVHEAPPLVDRACRGDERLPGHLAAEDPLAVLVRRSPAEDVDLDRLEVEQRHEIVERGLGGLAHPVGRSVGRSAARSP